MSIQTELVSKILHLPDTIPILIGQIGSKAYGTDTATSDDDFMSVCLAGKRIYFGLREWYNKGTYELKIINGDPVDTTVYEFKKFIRLCINFNPNVIPLLFLRPSDYGHISLLGEDLLKHRSMFISKELYFPFIGYANGQLSKVKNGVTGKLGEKRKTLVNEFGYDTKYAMHTIRLLRMGIEALTEGLIHVYRAGIDADELLDIRNGKWSLDKFLKEYETLFDISTKAYINSNLPEKPDYDQINDFVISSIQKYSII